MKLTVNEIRKIQCDVLKSLIEYKTKSNILGLLESKLTNEEVKQVLEYFDKIKNDEKLIQKLEYMVNKNEN